MQTGYTFVFTKNNGKVILFHLTSNEEREKELPFDQFTWKMGIQKRIQANFLN